MKDELTNVTIDADLREYMVNGEKFLLGIVSGRALKEIKRDIPNKPNTREYMGKKNKNVSEMIGTLRYKPEFFMHKNNGIQINATSYVKNDDGTTTIFFNDRNGTYNGNHTKNVLSKYGNEKSHVNIAVYFNVPEEEIVDITVSKNSSAPTQEISRGEKLGHYDWVKECLPNYQIKYKESDEFDLDIATVLHIAGIYQIDKDHYTFLNDNFKKFQSFLRSKGNIVKKFNDGKLDLKKTRYILKDVIDFYESIRFDEDILALVRRNLESKGWIRKGAVTDSLMYNIINATKFAFYIPNTLYPCLKDDYDVNRLIHLTKKVFPEITSKLTEYENEGFNVTEICRGINIYQEIQNLMLLELTK
ncbi:AIPR family protein [Amphibacillus sp. Q70]|uniref:AIPR family protein n=1 Tax=Amphibacillus sp. Q70 TaxID=3453416 RepID=UPI003F86DF37